MDTNKLRSANNASEKDSQMRSLILICVALIVIVCTVYAQVGNHEFLSYDDDIYVTDNPHVAAGLTGKGVIWAFTAVDAANWHPVTWLSHMADVEVFGMNPRGHHLTNVAIHAISTVVLLLFLLRMTGALWQSAFVAALFALHPLHVESVAWVAERKDVLSALFCFLTLLLYSEFTVKRKTLLYISTLVVFVLGLMSKPMLVTLPVVMLLLDYWPLGRCGGRGTGNGSQGSGIWDQKTENGKRDIPAGSTALSLVWEKIPFFACSLLSSVATIIAQQSGGAVKSLGMIPLQLRSENALIAYVTYIVKTIWPRDLAVLYPIPPSFPFWQVGGSLLVLLLISVATIRFRHRYPYLVAGWFWFLITLVPVIGIVQVGVQGMADRYSYLSSIGLFVMAAWGVSDLSQDRKYRERVLALLAGAVITVSTVLSWQQLGYWRDNTSLYMHTLRVTTGNYVIHNNLGIVQGYNGKMDAAIKEFNAALRINPNYSDARYNLGMTFAIIGDLEKAIWHLREALRIDPNNSKAYTNLGVVLDQQKRQRENRQ